VRVEVNNLSDFMDELGYEQASVVRSIVRFRVDREAEQAEEISFSVGFWATAMIATDEGAYVLELCQSTGCDEMTRDGIASGTANAANARSILEAECGRLGLSLRSGKIEAV